MPRALRPLLAMETSNIACSAALALESGITQVHEVIPRAHHERLPAMIDSLMHRAGLGGKDLRAVAFGRGPGSFTGVRLAAAVAQAWSLAHDLPVHAVSSLAALALQAGLKHAGPCRVLALVRARSGEVYTAEFDFQDGLLARVSEDRRMPANEVHPWVIDERAHLMVGDACLEVDSQGWEVDASLLAGAEAVSRLADRVPASSPESALPVYLQPDAAWGM